MKPKREFLFSRNTIQLYKDGLIDGFFISFMTRGRHITHFPHYHDYYEIVFCMGNETLPYYYKEQMFELHRGDIVFCNIFDTHLYDAARLEGYERISVAISTDLLLHLSTSDSNLLRLFDPSAPAYPVYHTDSLSFSSYLKLLLQLRDTPVQHGKKAMQRAILAQLLALMYNDTYTELPQHTKRYTQARLSSDLIKYVDSHLSETISLKDLSEEFNYSSSYLCRVFKEFTGDTLSSYIINKRLSYAAFLLNGSTSVSEVAKKAGFSNYSYFYKTFLRQYGMSPSDYRQAHQMSGEPV